MNTVFRCFMLLLLVSGCTKPPQPPVGQKIKIVTSNATNVTSSSAVCGGEVQGDQYSNITEKGICWNVSADPTIGNNFLSSGSATGSFTNTLTGLLPNKSYYVRAYIQNYAGTIYGNQISFQTPGNLPTITTSPISSITQTTAISGGTQINAGGLSITARGICWSISSNPTTSTNKTSNGSGTTPFTASMTGLNPNTVYYVRSYATNPIGTAYGQEIQFTTSGTLPTLATNAATSITSTSALTGGSISSDGGAAVIQRGVCWSSTVSNPTTSNFTLTNGSGTGNFSSFISGLTPNTVYYLRAFATNSVGTAYGQAIQFTTSSGLPTVSTNGISSINLNSAIGGGFVTSDGGAIVSQRGVCWSNLTTAPTTANSRTVDGTGVGTFTSSVSGLVPGTTYYVRAYATNSAGTNYGSTTSFTTSSLGTPSLASPANGSSRPCCSINFSWTTITGATSYEIQVSRSSAFTGSIYTVNVCGGASYPSTTGYSRAITASNAFCLSGGTSIHVGNWYWRVRAINGSANGAWSSIFYYYYSN